MLYRVRLTVVYSLHPRSRDSACLSSSSALADAVRHHLCLTSDPEGICKWSGWVSGGVLDQASGEAVCLDFDGEDHTIKISVLTFY